MGRHIHAGALPSRRCCCEWLCSWRSGETRLFDSSCGFGAGSANQKYVYDVATRGFIPSCLLQIMRRRDAPVVPDDPADPRSKRRRSLVEQAAQEDEPAELPPPPPPPPPPPLPAGQDPPSLLPHPRRRGSQSLRTSWRHRRRHPCPSPARPNSCLCLRTLSPANLRSCRHGRPHGRVPSRCRHGRLRGRFPSCCHPRRRPMKPRNRWQGCRRRQMQLCRCHLQKKTLLSRHCRLRPPA